MCPRAHVVIAHVLTPPQHHPLQAKQFARLENPTNKGPNTNSAEMISKLRQGEYYRQTECRERYTAAIPFPHPAPFLSLRFPGLSNTRLMRMHIFSGRINPTNSKWKWRATNNTSEAMDSGHVSTTCLRVLRSVHTSVHSNACVVTVDGRVNTSVHNVHGGDNRRHESVI